MSFSTIKKLFIDLAFGCTEKWSRPDDYFPIAESKIAGLFVSLVCKPLLRRTHKGSIVLKFACDFLEVKGEYREPANSFELVQTHE